MKSELHTGVFLIDASALYWSIHAIKWKTHNSTHRRFFCDNDDIPFSYFSQNVVFGLREFGKSLLNLKIILYSESHLKHNSEFKPGQFRSSEFGPVSSGGAHYSMLVSFLPALMLCLLPLSIHYCLEHIFRTLRLWKRVCESNVQSRFPFGSTGPFKHSAGCRVPVRACSRWWFRLACLPVPADLLVPQSTPCRRVYTHPSADTFFHCLPFFLGLLWPYGHSGSGRLMPRF